MWLNLKNIILYLCAQTASCGSGWALYIFLNWKIYTDYSIDSLAIYAFISGIPPLLLMNVGGILADKFNKKSGLVALQVVALILDLTLLIFLILNIENFFILLLYGTCIGILGAFNRPFNQAILLEIVDQTLVSKLLGLNSILFNLCRMGVPILVGVLLQSAYMVVAVSILLSLIALISYFFLGCKPFQHTSESQTFSELFLDQKDLVKKNPEFIFICIIAFFVSATLGAYTFLIPAFNDYLHQGNPSTLSYLYIVSGAGALSVGLFKMFGRTSLRVNMIPVLGISASVFLIVFIAQVNFYFEYMALYFLAISVLLVFISCSQRVYETIPLDRQGRFLSLLSLAIMGIAPFSNAAAGFLVSIVGIKNTCIIFSIICSATCLFVFMKLAKFRLRPRAID